MEATFPVQPLSAPILPFESPSFPSSYPYPHHIILDLLPSPPSSCPYPYHIIPAFLPSSYSPPPNTVVSNLTPAPHSPARNHLRDHSFPTTLAQLTSGSQPEPADTPPSSPSAYSFDDDEELDPIAHAFDGPSPRAYANSAQYPPARAMPRGKRLDAVPLSEQPDLREAYTAETDEATLNEVGAKLIERGKIKLEERERFIATVKAVVDGWKRHSPHSARGKICKAAGWEGLMEMMEEGLCEAGNHALDVLEGSDRIGEDDVVRAAGLSQEAAREIQSKGSVLYADAGLPTEFRIDEDGTVLDREIYGGSTFACLSRIFQQHLNIFSRFRNPSRHYRLTSFLDPVCSIVDSSLEIDPFKLAHRLGDLTVAEKEKRKLRVLVAALQKKPNPNLEVAGHVYLLIWFMGVGKMDERLIRWDLLREGMTKDDRKDLRRGLLELMEASFLVFRKLVTSAAVEERCPFLGETKLRKGLRSTNV
jgi:hypothetical protein